MFRYKTTFQQDNSLAFTYTIRIIYLRATASIFSIILSLLLILLCTFPIPSPFVLHICVACGSNFNFLHFITMNRFPSFLAVQPCIANSKPFNNG